MLFLTGGGCVWGQWVGRQPGALGEPLQGQQYRYNVLKPVLRVQKEFSAMASGSRHKGDLPKCQQISPSTLGGSRPDPSNWQPGGTQVR